MRVKAQSSARCAVRQVWPEGLPAVGASFALGLLTPLAILSSLKTCAALNTTVGLYTTQSPLFQAPSAISSSANVAYYGFFQVGEPGVYFRACFDTGSSSTWVPATACNSTSCEMHLRFNPSDSRTFRTDDAPFSTAYVTGGVSGIVFYDTLTVGGVQLRGQAMGLAEEETLDFALATCDGLFGLAFPSNSGQNLSVPFVSMLRLGILDEPVFSMWLNPNVFDSYAGELKFGTVDTQRYFGNMRFVNVTAEGGRPRYWQVALSGIAIGTAPVAVSATSAIIDSGSTLIFASQMDAHTINMAIPGMQGDPVSGVYNLTHGCSGLAGLPPLSLNVTGIRLTLLPEQYILQRANGALCASAIVGVMDNPSYIVLGTPFLRAYYTAYEISDVNNLASARIGFAAASGTGLSNVTSFLGL